MQRTILTASPIVGFPKVRVHPSGSRLKERRDPDFINVIGLANLFMYRFLADFGG